MSVGLGSIERRVLRVLEWERGNNGGALRRLLDYRDGKRAYQECDTTVGDLVDSILYGCNNNDHPYLKDRLGTVYRSLYQSVCRAVRSLERKGLVRTGKGVLFWEDGGWYKTVTLVDNRAKHLDTVKTNIGVNV
ncbi:unnamed protein product [marine sediment metagenome]|uniref:Uncharacterized protein n=1 Tax=marine sediment metagenome TaxID=412755 RepID=X1QXX9_9ZZZZ